MSKLLEGKVIIVTGAGNGVGKGIALEAGRHGARVLVNDLGVALDGSGADTGPAQQTVNEIKAAGGDAAANMDSVADYSSAEKNGAAVPRSVGPHRWRGEQCRQYARRDLPQNGRSRVRRRDQGAPQG